MQHERSNDGIAFECFHYGRTLAVLPLSPLLSSIVVTVSADQADAILALDDLHKAGKIGDKAYNLRRDQLKEQMRELS